MSGLGRGRGLFEALKKAQESEGSSGSPTPPSSRPGSSVPQSNVGSSISTGSGRGKAFEALKLMQRTNEPSPVYAAASDVKPSLAPSQGISKGRGARLLESFKAPVQASGPPREPAGAVGAAGDDVSELASAVASTTLTTTTAKSRCKIIKEVKDSAPVVRKGESGQRVDVTANFIYLLCDEKCVYEYEVKYSPPQDFKGTCMTLLNAHRDLFPVKTFDGTTLYIPHRLPDDVTTLSSQHPFDQSDVTLTIVFRRERRLSEMVHIYNVLFKQIMRDLNLVRFGRQHFDQHHTMVIAQHKLEVWPGFVTAVDEYEGGLMLTLDSAHRVLRTESVLELMRSLAAHDRHSWKQKLTETLMGCSVLTVYNNKLFKVDDLAENMTPLSTFKTSSGDEISFLDYYKKQYGIDILDHKQPLLISKQTKRMSGVEKPVEFQICLVPELCRLTGLTDDMRSNFRLMKDVATYTKITPNQRHAAFKKFLENVMSNEAARARLAGWGLSVAPETVSIAARTLQPEPIQFGNGQSVPGSLKAEWGMDVTRQPVIEAVDINNWLILFTAKDKRVTDDFVNTICRCGPPMGIRIARPQLVQLPSDRSDVYAQQLKQLIDKKLQLVVCICPTSRDDRYGVIKKICCADNPVPSQVINARTLMNPQKIRAIVQKIALQINVKLGGTLWAVNIPVRNVMVVGIDSYHEAKKRDSSVCAFVASYNSTFTKWWSKCVFQGKGQEIVDALKSCLVEAVNFYFKMNGSLPGRIIIFRDGVGDGQLRTVGGYEAPQLEVTCGEVDPSYRPQLSVVVVQKRINTRIFLKLNGGQYENPPPGTVVDHLITRRDWYDYLIVPQRVTQGTVTPTHYVVVYDRGGMTPDQMQRLTYKLCHLYYNWPGTVRVPAPCQYAHKLAYLVGQSMHKEPSPYLQDKLFFL